MSLLDLLRANGSISVNKALIHSIGLHEAILYCELAARQNYFEDREELANGYFFNTQYNLQAGTGLSEKMQRTAIANLKALRLIDCRLMGVPAKRYFLVKDDELTMKRLMQYIDEGKKKLKALENPSDMTIGRNLKGKRKELVTAKQCANNTKDNTNVIILMVKGILSSDKSSHYIPYDYVPVIKHFLMRYNEIIGEDHPIGNMQSWESVLDTLPYVDDVSYTNRTFDISEEANCDMIDQYFNTKFTNCDYHIWHYCSLRVKLNRMYEVAY